MMPNPSQWAGDVDFVRKYQYKTDIDCFQNYQTNHTKKGDHATINVKDHNTYINIARAAPGTVIEKSVATYREVPWLKRGDVDTFDGAISTKFPLSTKGSRAPDDEKVAIDRVMLVCKCPNGTNVAYADSDGFGSLGSSLQ